jgi:hypothetical protein
MIQTFSCTLSGPKKPKELASTPRSSTDLASLIYKGKHAQIQNKYFC